MIANFFERVGFGQGECFCQDCVFCNEEGCRLGMRRRKKGCKHFCYSKQGVYRLHRGFYLDVDYAAWKLGDDVILLHRIFPKLTDVLDKTHWTDDRDKACKALGNAGVLLWYHLEVLEMMVKKLNSIIYSIKTAMNKKQDNEGSRNFIPDFTPCNEKSLFHFLCHAMAAVATGQMPVDKATAVSKLASNGIMLMRNEIERGKLIEVCNQNNRVAQIRELAATGFDDTTAKYADRTPYVIEQQ